MHQTQQLAAAAAIRLLYKDVEVNHPLKDNDLSQVTNNNHVEVNHSLNDNDIELQQQNKSAEANHPLKDNDQLQVTNNHVDVNDPLNDNDIELQQPRNTASTSETTSNQSNTSANQVNQHNSTKIAVINDNRKMNQPVSKHLIPCPFQRRGFCKKGRLCDFLHIDFKPPNFMHQPSKTSHASYANQSVKSLTMLTDEYTILKYSQLKKKLINKFNLETFIAVYSLEILRLIFYS